MLITHPAVIDVAIWGEEVGAVVQLMAGRDASGKTLKPMLREELLSKPVNA